MCEHPICRKKELSRRDILRFGLAGTALATLGPWTKKGFAAPAMAPTADTRLIVLNCFGGNDILNTVVPHTLSAYASQRGSLALTTGQTLALTGGPGNSLYRLHPALPNLQTLWNEGSVALVNLVGYPQANGSHFESMDTYSTGIVNPNVSGGMSQSGWIARYADQYAATSTGAMSIGTSQPKDFVGGATDLFSGGTVFSSSSTPQNLFKFSGDSMYANATVHRQTIIKNILASFVKIGVTKDAADLLDQGFALEQQFQTAASSYSSSVSYSSQSLAQYFRNMAILIQGGFSTRIFYTGFSGFDTHGSQGTTSGAHPNLLSQINAAIGAFAQDMKDMGIWDKVVIAIISEFGRRNFANGSGGTDHGEAGGIILVGGAVNGGVYGPDLTDAIVNKSDLEYEVDFRSVFKEILADHLGASDLSLVFPEAQQKNVTLGVV